MDDVGGLSTDARKHSSDYLVVGTEDGQMMYKPKGDFVHIVEEPWNQFAGEYVVITKAEMVGEAPVYEFVIPERRGSTPEKLIGRLVARGMKFDR